MVFISLFLFSGVLVEEKRLIKSIQFATDFPRTPIGKIRVEELRKRITGQS